jgi:hypothetical protein
MLCVEAINSQSSSKRHVGHHYFMHVSKTEKYTGNYCLLVSCRAHTHYFSGIIILQYEFKRVFCMLDNDDI